MAGNRTGGRVARRLACGGVTAVAVALATAAGCGGSDGNAGAASPFCEEFAGYEQRFQGGASHDDVLAALRALDPPDEIAADVETLAGAVEQLSTVDSSNPSAVAEFQAGPSAEAEQANANILGYVEAECPEA
jgi:outer membrane murein-binding lipoprotein Lpp